jgi:hypothetical protein
MFEHVQQRQREQSRHWVRVLSIGVGGFTLFVLLLRWHLSAEEDRRVEASRAAYRSNPVLRAEARTYKRVELPGMSIEVPGTGTLQGDSDGGAYGGSYPLEFAVTWKRRENPDDAMRDEIFANMASSLQQELSLAHSPRELSRKDVSLGTARGHHVVFDAGQFLVAVTIGSCSGRMVVVIAGGHGATETSDHMIASFRCNPVTW